MSSTEKFLKSLAVIAAFALLAAVAVGWDRERTANASAIPSQIVHMASEFTAERQLDITVDPGVTDRESYPPLNATIVTQKATGRRWLLVNRIGTPNITAIVLPDR